MFHRRRSGTGSDPPGLLFLPARGNPDHPDIPDALLFLSVSRMRTKTKKQKETPRPTGFLAKLHTHFLANLRGKTDK